METYAVGIYARLSVDSHSEKNESIETQIEIAKDFLTLHPELVLYGCYTDLGRTGTDFKREGFERLMSDVRERKVNCIIVKDFSRFGRNYIETGSYLQKIFPFLGVRFISVADGYDSLCAKQDELGVNLKNLTNEMYARDISAKVKSSRKVQWESGSYTGGVAPYGYRTEWHGGKKCLVEEKVTGDIVRTLYRLFDEGKTVGELTVWLYEQKIHRPREYRRYGHPRMEEGEELQKWDRGTVRILLTNPVYLGCLVQNAAGKKDYCLRSRKDMESGAWTVQKGTHGAIVEEELFFGVAEKIRKPHVRSGQKNPLHSREIVPELFEGMVYCGECKKKMGKSNGYFCKNSFWAGACSCERKYIPFRTLKKLVGMALRTEFALAAADRIELTGRSAFMQAKRKTEQKQKKIEAQMKGQKMRESGQYLRYQSGELTREAFLHRKAEQERLAERLKAEQERGSVRLCALTEEEGRTEKRIRSLLADLGEPELDRELAQSLIEMIEVFPDKRIEIRFRFQSEEFMQEKGGGVNHEPTV